MGQPSLAVITASTSSSLMESPWRSRSSSAHSMALKLSSAGPISSNLPEARSLLTRIDSGWRLAIASDSGAPRTPRS